MTSKRSSGENSNSKAIIICGPTGSGKSQLGMLLAERYGGRIISADSRQIYRRLDIGTAKPSPEDRKRIPHYMIDVADITEEFTAKRYAEMGSNALQETLDSGSLPFVVGGAGLYLEALTAGIFEGPPRDEMLRRELEARAAELGPAQLHKELSGIDMETAVELSPSDKVRIIRALEVYRVTGHTISELQKTGKYLRPDIEFLWLGMTYERKKLYASINDRVDRMVGDGLIEEVRTLASDGFGNSLRQKKIVGYYEVLEAMDGRDSVERAIELMKQHSRNYAKRQLTWFRNKSPVHWLIPDQLKFYDEVFRIIDDYLNKRLDLEQDYYY
jgi:tRNA dimethylallyltransferase